MLVGNRCGSPSERRGRRSLQVAAKLTGQTVGNGAPTVPCSQVSYCAVYRLNRGGSERRGRRSLQVAAKLTG
ncbi:MAG: hypothetical protein GX376_08610 [Firmicutes bacterium]|nr:hypothetical protein [Bacillota bacterium]